MAKKTTIKGLSKMSNEMFGSTDYFDILYYWMECGYQDMVATFDKMSKKETLQVIGRCVNELEVLNGSVVSNMYKCAMTSLEKRL